MFSRTRLMAIDRSARLNSASWLVSHNTRDSYCSTSAYVAARSNLIISACPQRQDALNLDTLSSLLITCSNLPRFTWFQDNWTFVCLFASSGRTWPEDLQVTDTCTCNFSELRDYPDIFNNVHILMVISWSILLEIGAERIEATIIPKVCKRMISFATLIQVTAALDVVLVRNGRTSLSLTEKGEFRTTIFRRSPRKSV